MNVLFGHTEGMGWEVEEGRSTVMYISLLSASAYIIILST
jgi:hypothetical protein